MIFSFRVRLPLNSFLWTERRGVKENAWSHSNIKIIKIDIYVLVIYKKKITFKEAEFHK